MSVCLSLSLPILRYAVPSAALAPHLAMKTFFPSTFLHPLVGALPLLLLPTLLFVRAMSVLVSLHQSTDRHGTHHE